jgi:hypothetical protein
MWRCKECRDKTSDAGGIFEEIGESVRLTEIKVDNQEEEMHEIENVLNKQKY